MSLLCRGLWLLLLFHAEKSDKLFELSTNYCIKGIVIATDSSLFQIEMSEHNNYSLLCGGELYDNLFSQLSSTL